MKFKFTLLFIISLVADALAQTRTIKINRTANNPEEVTIAINPLQPSQMVAASNISNLYLTADSGKTWSEHTLTSTLGVWGDPVLLFNNRGNLFFAHLNKNPLKQFPNWIDRIVVQASTDNGNKFNDGAGIGLNGNKVQDKPWMCADARNKKTYICWTEFDKYNSRNTSDRSRIRFSHADENGKLWSEPVVISDTEGDCLDSDSTMEGATPAVDRNGNVYVAWSGFNQIYLDKSSDGGNTFGKDKIVTQQIEGWDIPLKKIYRTNGMPFLACDTTTGPYSNRLYLSWSDTRNGDADVLLVSSSDGGETWTSPIKVNNDSTKNGCDQFCNYMYVDPITGIVYIIFYDRRNSPSANFMDVYLAFSKDGGKTFTNRRITNASFPCPGKAVFFGDYIGLSAFNGMIRPIWTDWDNYSLNIYTALLWQRDLDGAAIENKSASMNLRCEQYTIWMHYLVPAGEKYSISMRTGKNKYKVLKNGIGKGFDEEINITSLDIADSEFEAILIAGKKTRIKSKVNISYND